MLQTIIALTRACTDSVLSTDPDLGYGLKLQSQTTKTIYYCHDPYHTPAKNEVKGHSNQKKSGNGETDRGQTDKADCITFLANAVDNKTL